MGPAGSVDAMVDQLRVAHDTFAWPATAPTGAVFAGVVADTLGTGAVVDLGDAEGFLPFDRVPDYVETDDAVRVQVADGRPPWSDERPVLSGRLRVRRGPVTLVRDGTDGAVDGVDRLDLLAADPPSGWGVRWAADADEVPLDALDAALGSAADRAETLEAAVTGALDRPAASPERLDDGRALTWVWFGRDSRFALDERRRAVTPTLPGHHRIKVGGDRASRAVDFAEAVCGGHASDAGADGDLDDHRSAFPVGVVLEQFGPASGDRVAIHHGKPDGRWIVLGRGTVTDVSPDGQVTVRRAISAGGTYDALGTDRREGDVAVTRFREGRWWYPTVYRGEDGTVRGTYVNVCTPVEVLPERVQYVDLHVDVVRHPDGRVERVDDDELDAAAAAGHLEASLAERARAVAARVVDAL